MYAGEVAIRRGPRQPSISSASLSNATTVCLVDTELMVLDQMCIISLHHYTLIACDEDVAL